jgi:hypothetical protein
MKKKIKKKNNFGKKKNTKWHKIFLMLNIRKIIL